MKNKLTFAFVLLAGFAAGVFIRGCGSGHERMPASEHGKPEASATVWTCSMHPQIRQPGPGKCPLCGMDLIPVEEHGGGSAGERTITLSPSAQKLARVETVTVVRKPVRAEVRMVGKIAFDETRFRDVTLLSDGQVRRLFVNYVGVPVRAGDHLAEIYSPDVFAASRELVVAARAAGSDGVAQAARQKLRLLGVNDRQIQEIEKNGQASDTYVVYSPISGYVTRLEVNEGGWVGRGGLLVTVADTSTVWAQLDAYEKDIGFIHYGQHVDLEVEALPGRSFTGFVAFIPPEVNEMTRSIKVRLNVPNPEAVLKPGMFTRALLTATMTPDGLEIAPDLAEKWLCPMHPEVVRDEAGQCPICGMDLVTGGSLGFVGHAASTESGPLVIPASAPLITGTRAVVYVADPVAEGSYAGREIELGARVGDFYIVKSGLREGELVVTKGNLQIDSAVQILAKPSMMSPAAPMIAGEQEDNTVMGDIPPLFRTSLDPVYVSYFDIQRALASDDGDRAKAAAGECIAALRDVDSASLVGASLEMWTSDAGQLSAHAAAIRNAADIEEARAAFASLSDSLARVIRRFGTDGRFPVYLAHCPMAFDSKGADWLQDQRAIRNPYFGSEMLECGSIKATIAAGRDGEPK